MKFKKSSIIINKDSVNGYNVINPGPNFRGLKVFLINSEGHWFAYEKTTGSPLTPGSYAGGLSNRTRAGVMQIVDIFLEQLPEVRWESIEKKLPYPLKKGE